ncbi:MAG: ATP-binding protein, partial [Rhodothalassiaceae bacterium]
TATVTVTLSRKGDHVELVVEDEGPGLPADAADRIFERFYSERPDQEAFGTHSGLGLSISKQIVEAHRGTIRAENRVEPDPVTGEKRILGARFIVTLPRA